MPSLPGWYPDPHGDHQYRWWDGERWTDDVADAGVAATDPLGSPSRPADDAGAPRVPSRPDDDAGAPPPVPATEDAGRPAGAGGSARPRRTWWLVGGLGAAAVAVVVAVVLVVGGGDGGRAEPLAGVFEGGGDNVAVSLVVVDPPGLGELSIDAPCGPVSTSQTIEFPNPIPIEDGRFEFSLPPPGGLEIDGTFVDGGRRVEGHVVAGGCDEDWAADLVDTDDATDDATDDVTPTDNAVEWVTPDATLTADNFHVTANGLVFTAATGEVDVHGDAADGGDDTTIEVTWFEHDREMRLFVYLESDTDGWWADEIRTYDGAADGDWVYFSDRYFESPVGVAFEADVFEIEGTADDTGATVVVHFEGLRVETTLAGGDDDTSDTTVPDDSASDTTVPDDSDDDTSDTTVPDDGGVPLDETVVRDDFDGSLDAAWSWSNEDPDRWSLDTRPGWLSIEAQDVTPTGIANTLVRPAPLVDDTVAFVVTTVVAFEPTSNFQFAGLIVTGGDPDTDRVQFGRAFCDAQVCVGDGLYVDRYESGELIGDNLAVPIDDTPELYLQLVVVTEDAPGFEDAGGATVFAGYSFDGDEWFSAGDHVVDFDVELVGLVAHQAPTQITASFDFFEIESFTE